MQDDKPGPWIRCGCTEYWCREHGMHAHECDCPPIEEWEGSPYGQAGDSWRPPGGRLPYPYTQRPDAIARYERLMVLLATEQPIAPGIASEVRSLAALLSRSEGKRFDDLAALLAAREAE